MPTRLTKLATINTGRPKPRGEKTIYQQQLRYLQTQGIDSNPRRLFATDFLACLLTWRGQGERLLIFWDANEHILDGELSRILMERLDMVEVCHQFWNGERPNTHIRGSEPIDGCLASRELEFTSHRLKSFHLSAGDHRSYLLDVTSH